MKEKAFTRAKYANFTSVHIDSNHIKNSDCACCTSEINKTSKKNEKQLYIFIYMYMFRSISQKEIDVNDSPHFPHFDRYTLEIHLDLTVFRINHPNRKLSKVS